MLRSWSISASSLWRLGALMLLLLGVAAPGMGSPARFFSGHFIVSDLDADPRLFFTQPGAVFTINPAYSTILRPVYTPREFVHPVRAISGPKKLLYIVDSDADPLGFGDRNGVVFVHDTRASLTLTPTVIAASPRFREPVDVLLDELGRLIILDQVANPLAVGSSHGAVFRFDPADQSEEVLAASEFFRLPKRMIRDLDGTLLILDATADPLGFGVNAGTVFRLDTQLRTLSVVFSIPGFERLESLRLDPDGHYILVDRDADPMGLGGKPGALFRIDRNTLEFDGVVVTNPDFVDPVDVVYDEEGKLYVLDRFANVFDHPATRGALYRMNQETSDIEDTWVTSDLRSPVSIELVTGADLDSSAVVFVDLNGSPVLPGDLLDVQLKIKNSGDRTATSVTLADTLTRGFSAVGGSFDATSGEVHYVPEADAFVWTGDVPADSVEEIHFQATVEETGSQIIQQSIHATSDSVDLLLNWVFPVEFAFRGGTVLVSDPSGIHALVEGSSMLIPVTNHPSLFSPMGTVFTPEGRLIIADSGAEMVQNQPGAIFQLEPGGAMGVLTAGLPLRAPSDVALDPGGNIYVASVGVALPDPFPSVPGGVYRLDPISFQPESLHVGDPLFHPISLLVDESNRLFVVDFGADPLETGEGPGAVFQIDRETGQVRRTFTHPDFVDPVGITKLTDGRLIVADQSADPLSLGGNTGALFQIDLRTGIVDLLLATSELVSPFSVVQDTLGNVLIADLEGDPGGSGAFSGTILSYDLEEDELSTIVSNLTLRGPRGLTIRKLGDFRNSRIEGGDTNGHPFLVEDTLSVHAVLTNSGESTVPAVAAEFTGSPALMVLSYVSSSGVIGVLPGTNLVKWVGAIPRGDSVEVSASYIVRPDQPGNGVSFWEPLNVALEIRGPFAPQADPVSARLATPMRRGDHIVVDSNADLLGIGGDTGCLFLVDSETGGARLLYANEQLVDPVSVLLDSLGNIIILDAGADPGGTGTARGAIFRLDVWTEELEPTFWSDSLSGPVEIVPEPDGTYLLVDETAQITGEPEQRGAIFRLETLEGPLRLVSADPAFRLIKDVLPLPDGDLLVTDVFANPFGLSGNSGAIFRVDPETGSVVDTIQTEDLADPYDLEFLPDGRVLVTDASANPRNLPPPTGALFVLDPVTQEPELFALSSFFVQPHRSKVTSDGRILVADRSARLPGEQGYHGAILQVEMETRRVTFLAGTLDFSVLRNHWIVPFPAVRIGSFTCEDENLFPLEPGDFLLYNVELVNTGWLDEAHAVFADTLPPEMTLLPQSVQADAGEIRTEGPVLTWTGPVAGGEGVQISYRAFIDPLTSQGARIRRQVTVSGEESRPLSASLEHVVATTLDPGTMYVVDTDADPFGVGLAPGALLKVTFPLGYITPVASSVDLSTPVDVELLSPTDKTFLILDADADPLSFGHRGGALFIADARDGSISFFATDSTFIEPSQLLRVSEEEFLVLDLVADPYGFRVSALGPGAIYRVTVPDGEVEIVYSDTVLVRPGGIALDGQGGLYIADKEADPLGFGWNKGAIFRLDLNTKEIETVTVDSLFVDPGRIAVLPSGDLLVLDLSARPIFAPGARGAVFWAEDQGRGEVRLHSWSQDFRDVRDLFLDGNNSVFVVDRESDPVGYGNNPGAVFRYNATARKYLPLATGPPLRNPSTAFVHMAMTPVVLKSLDAVSLEEGGVLLLWEVTADVEPTGYLVMRRPLNGDGAYEVLNPSEPVTGSGALAYIDDTVEPGHSYSYMIAALQSDGGFVYLGPVEVEVQAQKLRFALEQPAPNPFRRTTALRYSVPIRQEVELIIYDLQGRVVRRLVQGIHEPGVHTAVWDGMNQSRHPVASGIYFARFTGEEGERTRRITVLR